MVQGCFIYDDNVSLYLSYGLQRKFRQTTDISFESVVVKGIMLQFVKSTRGGDSQHNISVAPLKKRREQSMIIRNILIVSLFLFLLMLIMGCSYKPMWDPTTSKVHAYYDDKQHCQYLIQEQTGAWDYGYNEAKYISRCLEGRGYIILNGE